MGLDCTRATALQVAAFLGRLDIAELLLQYGADVNAPPSIYGYGGGTAIQLAAKKRLLRHDAFPCLQRRRYELSSHTIS